MRRQTRRALYGAFSMITVSICILSFQNCGRTPIYNRDEAMKLNEDLTSSDLNSKALDVFEKNCLVCHSSAFASGTTFNFADNLNQIADSRFVVKGTPSASLLFNVVNDGRMPKNRIVNTQDVNALRDWIQAGALNN